MNKTLVISKEGVSIYGETLDNSGKLGRYQVVSDFYRNNSEVYHTYAEAEKRFQALIGKKSFSVN